MTIKESFGTSITKAVPMVAILWMLRFEKSL
jgi:hypothetical protein